MLVWRFFEAKAFGKGIQIVLLVVELVAFARGALGVEVQQLGGGIAHLRGSLALGALPLATAEAMQLNRFGVGTAVARDNLQLRDWHIQRVAAGIFEMQEFVVTIAVVEVHQPLIAADAMTFMHDRIADLQLGQVAQPAFQIAAAVFCALAARAGGGRV